MRSSSTDRATVVLVRGAWANGSSWRRIVVRLQQQGFEVIVAQNPTASLAGDCTGHLRTSVQSRITNVAQVLSEAEGRVLADNQPPPSLTAFDDKVTRPAWMGWLCRRAVSSENWAVSVALQRELAVWFGANTIKLKASHISLLSQSGAVAAVIAETVAAIGGGERSSVA